MQTDVHILVYIRVHINTRTMCIININVSYVCDLLVGWLIN